MHYYLLKNILNVYMSQLYEKNKSFDTYQLMHQQLNLFKKSNIYSYV